VMVERRGRHGVIVASPYRKSKTRIPRFWDGLEAPSSVACSETDDWWESWRDPATRSSIR
jgi:hypothetical protein